ncbi:MAG: hypothetical protein IJ803_03885 [Oribacterium sp.]|nr:hypothetical protein [Oribacterium sp.]
MGTNGDDEVVIDLLDILAYFFQKWKYLLAGLVLGVLLIGVPLTYRQYRQIESKYADTTLDAIQEDMTKGEIETVNQLYNRYKTFRKRITNNQYYMDHSILMNMDPNNVSNYYVSYVFEADQRTAVDYFNDFSLNLDDYKDIALILGNEADPRFAYEVLSIRCTAAADDKIIDADMPDKIIVNGDISNKYRGLVKLRIKASNREQCEKIAGIVDKALSKAVTELTDIGVTVKLTQSGVNYTESVDTGLVEQQQSRMAMGSELVASYNAFEKDNKSSLNSQEQKLFEYMIHHDDFVTQRPSWKKYVVVGGFAGAFAVAVILCLMYLFAGDFKTVADISRFTGIKMIGCIYRKEKPFKGLDKLFLGIAKSIKLRGLTEQQDEEAAAVTVTRISEYCKQKNIDHIFIARDDSSDYSKTITDQMVNDLKSQISVVEAGDPLKSPEDLKKLHSSKMVVRIITLDKARKIALKELKEMCAEVSIPVFGDVVIINS